MLRRLISTITASLRRQQGLRVQSAAAVNEAVASSPLKGSTVHCLASPAGTTSLCAISSSGRPLPVPLQPRDEIQPLGIAAQQLGAECRSESATCFR